MPQSAEKTLEEIQSFLDAGWPSYLLKVAKGEIPGVSAVHKFGRNPDIDAAFEAIWNGGGDYSGFDAVAAETVEVFSSDDADNGATATGALTIQIYGLDANGAPQSEVVTLNGTAPVETAATYVRLDRMIVRSAGSGGVNAGAITSRQKVTTANVFAVLPIGYNQTMIAAYTIPAGKEGVLVAWFAALAKKQAAFSNCRLLMRPPGEVFQVKEEFTLASTGTSYVKRDYEVPKGGDSLGERITALTDIKLMADTDTVNSGVAAGFDLILFDI